MILFLAIASGGAKIHVIFESLPTYDRKGRCKVKFSYFQLGVSGIFEEATRKQSPCTLTWRKPLPRFVSVKGFLCRYTYLHNPVFNIKTRNTNFLWVYFPSTVDWSFLGPKIAWRHHHHGYDKGLAIREERRLRAEMRLHRWLVSDVHLKIKT